MKRKSVGLMGSVSFVLAGDLRLRRSPAGYGTQGGGDPVTFVEKSKTHHNADSLYSLWNKEGCRLFRTQSVWLLCANRFFAVLSAGRLGRLVGRRDNRSYPFRN